MKGRLGWQNLRADEYTESGPYLVSSEHLVDGSVDWASCNHVSEERYALAPEIQLRPDDLFVMKDGAALGKLGYVHELPSPACLSSHLLLFRARDSAWVPRFLFYVLDSMVFRAFLEVRQTGTTFFGVSQESIGEFPLSIPSIPEQERLAAFLDRKTAAIGALVAKKEQFIELLQEGRQAFVAQAVTNGLNPSAQMKETGLEWLPCVPAHWQVTRFKYLVDIFGGLQMGPFGTSLKEAVRYEEDDFKVYGQENTISGDFQASKRWISPSWFEQLSQYELCAGDIVMTRKGSLGNCRMAPQGIQRGIIDSDTIRVRLRRDRMVPTFLVRVLHEAHYLAQQLEQSKRGAILSGLNTSTVGNLTIAVPPIEEQHAIMSDVQRTCDARDRVARQALLAVEKLREYRQALIVAAITGKIDVSKEPG